MQIKSTRDIELAVPYTQRKEIVSSSRYRWNCWDRGSNPFVILQWTLSGEGVYEGKEGRFQVSADHAFIAVLPEQSTYYYPPEQKEPWIFSWFNFYGPLACDLFLKFKAQFGPVVPLAPRGPAATYLRRLYVKSARAEASDRFQTSLQSYAFLLEWWREALQPPRRPEDRLAHALRFSREHFREAVGVKELASEAGMSREHFSRIFTERTGESPSDYLQRLRMREATQLVQDTDLPLREIAMRSGFYSERHLMRTFQRIHGLSPSQYRKKATSKSRS